MPVKRVTECAYEKVGGHRELLPARCAPADLGAHLSESHPGGQSAASAKSEK